MLKAILKLSVFVLSVALIFFSANEVVSYLLNSPQFYKVPADKRILIVGNSQSERGLNDTIIEQSINLSQSGDSHFYNYYKIKKILEANPQLTHVLLVYTNNNFFIEMDNWVYDEQHMGFKYPKYAHLISFSDRCFLLYKNTGSFLVACRDAFRSNIQLLLRHSNTLYKKMEWGKFESVNEVIDFSKPHTQIDAFYADSSISKIDLQYLRKIDWLCKQEKKQLILIRMPMHREFPKTNDSEVFSWHSRHFKHLPLWDYMEYLTEDSCYKDVQHVNTAGANIVSSLVNQRFKEQYPELNSPFNLTK